MAEKDDDKQQSKTPDYPVIDLESAVSRIQDFYKAEKKNAASPDVLASHWKLTPKSSAVGLTASALKKFGLLEKAEVGKVKLSDLALNIVLDEEGSADRLAAIQTAATSPQLYGILWNKYKAELPSDTSLKKMLVMEMGFHDKIAVDIINKYRRTIAYARLADGNVEPMPQVPEQRLSPSMPLLSSPTLPKPQAKHPGSREIRLNLDHGEILVSLPNGTTATEIELLVDTLNLWKKRMAKGDNGQKEKEEIVE